MEKQGRGQRGGNRAKELVEKLERHPELMERFEAIVAITEVQQAERLMGADEVEDQLIEEVRKVGNLAMRDWAVEAEKRAGQEWKQKTDRGRVKKKDHPMVVHLRRGECRGKNLANAHSWIPETFCESSRGEPPS
jgi:hypothetical protein